MRRERGNNSPGTLSKMMKGEASNEKYREVESPY